MFSRRGVSEVIAAMLLILISVSAAVLLYAFASGAMGGLQGNNLQQSYLENLSLEYYDWTQLTTLSLTLRNTGNAKIALVDFFIGGTRNTTTLTFRSGCNSPNGVLAVQSSCVVSFPVPSGLTPTPGVTYSVKLVAKDGAVFSFSCIAGQTT